MIRKLIDFQEILDIIHIYHFLKEKSKKLWIFIFLSFELEFLGFLIITSKWLIWNSNLNKQFLYRKNDIKKLNKKLNNPFQ